MNRFGNFTGRAADKIANPLIWLIALLLSVFLTGCGSSNVGEPGNTATITLGEKVLAGNVLAVNDVRSFTVAASAVAPPTPPIQPSSGLFGWGEMSVSRVVNWVRWTLSPTQ